MKRSTAVASEESVRSPSIPPIRFDFNDEPRRPDVDDSPYMAPFSSQDNYSYERGSKDLVKRTRIYNTDEGSSLERLPKDFYARQPVPRLSSKFPGNTLSSFNTAGPFCSSKHKYDFGAFRELSDEASEFADVNIPIGRHMAQRESHDDSTHVELVPSPGVPSIPRTGLRSHPSAQLQPSSRTPRPAFDVYKAASSVEEGEREKTNVVRMNHTSHHMAKMNELYERERNLWFQQRGSNRQCREMSRGISNPPAQEMSFQRNSIGECQEMSNPRQSLRNRSVFDMRTKEPSSNLHSVQNATLRSSKLSDDEKAYLRLIRDFAYLHREPNTHGFRTLENITSSLPPKSMDYWVQLIQTHLQEVEIDKFRNTHTIVWRGGDELD